MRTIFKTLRGSHAHGLATEKSDRDYFSIVIPPAEAIIGLSEMKGSQRIEGDEDHRIITLREFLLAVEHGRSTELEMLWATKNCLLEVSSEGQTLIRNRTRLLSQRLFRPLMGFAGGQILRSLKGNNGRYEADLGYDTKSMTHAFRSLYQAISLKQSPALPLRVEDGMADFLMKVKRGEFSREAIIHGITEYEQTVKDEPYAWDIPEAPDRDWMEHFLMQTYSTVAIEWRYQ